MNLFHLQHRNDELLAMIASVESDYDQLNFYELKRRADVMSLIVSLRKQQSKVREEIIVLMLTDRGHL
jgi:hypothetical protein